MMTTIPCKLFLLGGYDLEMLTIKQLLDGKEGCVVLDRHLNWSNAKVSAYYEDMKRYADWEIYGIELQEDVPTHPHYHRIDHHNEWAGKPSALEQVADLLDVELDRFQQLVAANDKDYIPAMKDLRATDEEIADIRKRDRMAQGVSDEDEQKATEAITENLTRYGDLLVVKSETSRFAPICDRLFPYEKLLVYTDSEWMFYGEGKSKLVKLFEEEMKNKRIFHGGGDNGYVGAVKHAFNEDEINQIVNLIITEI